MPKSVGTFHNFTGITIFSLQFRQPYQLSSLLSSPHARTYSCYYSFLPISFEVPEEQQNRAEHLLNHLFLTLTPSMTQATLFYANPSH